MTEMKPAIRAIGPDELAAVADLRRSMVLELSDNDLDVTSSGWRERYQSFFGEQLKADRGVVFVAENGGVFVATAAAYLPVSHRSVVVLRPSAYICNVYVAPEFRRQGLARALTLRAVQWAKGRGCDVARLRASRMGRTVYERIGFKPTDELELDLISET